jgi:hypothetical protein
MMNPFSIVDESFDPALSSSYYLSIQVSLDGFSFCTYDPIRNRFIQFKETIFVKPDADWSLTLNLINTEDLFKLWYKKVIILYNTSHYTVIPSSLYKSEKAEALLSFTHHESLEGKLLQTNKIRMADVMNLFAVPTSVLNGITKATSCGTIHHIHHLTPFLESEPKIDINREKDTVIRLLLGENQFDVVILEHKELKLCNHFTFSNENELLYFLLFIYDQAKIQPEKTQVLASGNVNRSSNRFDLLKSYFKNIAIESPESHLIFGFDTRQIDQSKHINLFNSILCV